MSTIQVYDSLKEHATERDIRNHFGLLQLMVKELEARVSACEKALRISQRTLEEVRQQQATLAQNTPEEGA